MLLLLSNPELAKREVCSLRTWPTMLTPRIYLLSCLLSHLLLFVVITRLQCFYIPLSILPSNTFFFLYHYVLQKVHKGKKNCFIPKFNSISSIDVSMVLNRAF